MALKVKAVKEVLTINCRWLFLLEVLEQPSNRDGLNVSMYKAKVKASGLVFEVKAKASDHRNTESMQK